MDPFSIALGGITICQIASKIIQLGIAYGQAASAVPEEMKLLVSEITLLNGVFTALCSSLGTGDRATTIADGLKDTVIECNNKLEELHAFLVKQQDTSGSRLRKLGRALKWPLQEQDTRDWIARMERFKKTFSLAMQQENSVALMRAIDEVRESRRADEAERIANKRERQSKAFKEIIAWLSPADPRDNQDAARKLQQRGTGQWFTTSKDFEVWKTEANPIMWLHGSAGTGKSILCSIILDHLLQEEQELGEESPTRTIYFYCDYRNADKRTPAGIYGSIIAQLVERYSPDKIPSDLDDEFQKTRPGPPTESFLRRCLLMLAAKMTSKRTRIVVDALDECTPTARVEVLQTLMEFNQLGNISLLFTSRDELDIKAVLAKVPQLRIDASVNSKDINAFVIDECDRNDKLKRKLRGSTKQEVISAISSQAEGMFRWAKCQLDQIACLRNDKAIKKALKSLPPGLNETYERIVAGISEDDRDLALRILRWLTCSLRPLSVRELVEGIAIELGDTELDPETFLNDPEDIIEICGSLVQLDIHADTVTLGHFSVKEFFVARELKTGPHSYYFIDTRESNVELAKLCLTYLCLGHFRDGPCAEIEDLRLRFDTWALYMYACKYWGEHAEDYTDADDKDADETSFMSIVEHLFLDHDMEGNFDAWTQVYAGPNVATEEKIAGGKNNYLYHDQRRENRPLTYACALGLYSVTKFLLSKGVGDVRALHVDGESRSWSYGSALHAACRSGKVEVARLIVEAGADVNAVAGRDRLPLNVAVKACETRSGPSDFRLVKYLIEKGADVNRVTGDNDTPLHFATDGSVASIEGIKILLDAGADLSKRNSYGATAFEWAGGWGQTRVFEVLRQYGGGKHMDSNLPILGEVECGVSMHELLCAASSNCYESAQKILQKDGVAMFKEPKVEHILHDVSCVVTGKGYYKFLEQMLAYTDKSFSALPNCIKIAAGRGLPKTLRVLLDVYQPSPEDQMLRDLIVLAAGRDQIDIIEELSRIGVPMDSVDQHGWTINRVTQLTSLNKPVDPTLFADVRTGVEPIVKKPSGWQLRPLLYNAEVRPNVVFEGSSAYLPPGEPTCTIVFDHPIPPQTPYFYFENTVEELDGNLDFSLASVCTQYDKEEYDTCYASKGGINGIVNRWMDDWPKYGKGSVIGCAVDLKNHNALLTLDGNVLDFRCKNVRGLVCCHFTLTAGARIRSNFGEEPFLCDAALLKEKLAWDGPHEDGRIFTFRDRKIQTPGPKFFRGDGGGDLYIG